MKTRGLILLAVAVLLVGARPAVAQTYRFDLGVNGGYSVWTTMLSSDVTGGASAKFSPGWLLGAQMTLWPTARVGLRANLAYSDRSVDGGDGDLVLPAGDPTALDHVNVWSATGDLMLRLKEPAREFRGGEWLPYIALGAGLRYINPAGDRYFVIDNENLKTWETVPFSGVSSGTPLYDMAELSHVMFLAALGSDVRLARNVAARLEVGDRFSKPRIYQVQATSLPTIFTAIDGDNNRASLAHELYGQVGLHLTLGGAGAAAPVVVAPPPPPPPPVQQPPAPPPPAPPPPREEQITVCVIDPAAAGGVRSVNAIRVIESGDTLVIQNGNRVSLRNTLPTVALVGSTDWYVAGRPLALQLPRSQAQYLAMGRGETIGSGRLTLLGSVQGMPVYAEQSSVAGVATQLQQVNASGPADLVATLRTNAPIRTAFEQVRVLYVPAQTVGCVFQPLQLQEEVRKSGI